MIKYTIHIITLLFLHSTAFSAFDFVITNNTCRQMEVKFSEAPYPLRLFPYTNHTFSIDNNRPFYIQWRRVFGSLKGTRLGELQLGETYELYINPQTTPLRQNDGLIEILSEDGYYKQLITTQDSNKVHKLEPLRAES